MSGVPGGAGTTDMNGASDPQSHRTTGSAQEDASPLPWAALTKGECLLLAQALHRLSRINAHPSRAGEEDRP
jgi:hypothetical protein